MGKLYISTTTGCTGSSFTSWKQFEKLIYSWEEKDAYVEIEEFYCGRPLYVTATFKDGVERTARYSPNETEKDKAAFLCSTYPDGDEDEINCC
jgi:hypothetical protein